MRKLYYILVLSVLASCYWRDKDSDIFNGEIVNIEDNAVNKTVEFKELTLNGPNFGPLAIYDSIALFMNPSLPFYWYQLFDCHSLNEMGRFAGKGRGHNEFIAAGPIWNFYTENDDLKTLIFDPNHESVSIWNITKSLADSSTVIEGQIRLPWKKENRGACFKELFMTGSYILYAKVSTVKINEYEATLPYYQKWDLKSGEKISDIHVFKKTIVNKNTKYLPEFFFYSSNAIKPDGSKIVQAMEYVPQLNIIDTESKKVVAYHLDSDMSLSDLERVKDLKSYFTRVCADDDHIYAAFYGDIWNDNDINDLNQIYVFDWDGRLVSKVTANHCIEEMALDNINNVLYTTSPMNEKLYCISTDELTGNSN